MRLILPIEFQGWACNPGQANESNCPRYRHMVHRDELQSISVFSGLLLEPLEKKKLAISTEVTKLSKRAMK
jgi:hypothetical protein